MCAKSEVGRELDGIEPKFSREIVTVDVDAAVRSFLGEAHRYSAFDSDFENLEKAMEL